jgi:hypothetical protein
MKVTEKLIQIQKELKAPKDLYNKHGNYYYRSCESILQAVKGLMDDKFYILLEDEIIQLGDRYYVKATASLCSNEGGSISTSAYAREDVNRKGMMDSQLTGATSSYARKYALNALFAIEDTKDGDTLNDKTKETKQKLPENLGDYVVTIGKFKGIKISDILPQDLIGYCKYIKEKSEKDGKPINGVMKDFMEVARNYLKQQEGGM